jgi:hypothetical protein
MKSVKDPAAVIGLQGQLRTAEGPRVDVGVGDARKAYPRIDYRITPLAGEGVAGATSRYPELGSNA